MSWVLFSLLAAFTWAIVNTVDKYVLTKWVRKPIVPVMILGVVGLVASIAVYLIHGFSRLSYTNILLAFIAGVFYLLMSLFYFKAVKIEEISRVVPLFHLTPLFILILASIFLGEFFAPVKYLGILLLVIGAVLISTKKITSIRFGKAFWLMILSSMCIAINMVITKYLLDFADFWTVFSWTRIGTVVALIPAYFIYYPDLLLTVREHGRKVLGVISFNESLNIGGVIFITIAASVGYITLVNALSSIRPFFVLLFAVLLSVFYPRILKEEIGKSTVLLKIIAIVLMFTGAVLIS